MNQQTLSAKPLDRILSMKRIFLGLLVMTWVVVAQAVDPTLAIDVGHTVGKASPLLYGLMTEEISHSYDGGLYAELVRNRAFLDHESQPVHWTVFQADGAAASIALDHTTPVNDQLTNSLRLDVTSASSASPAGVANDGYWGIPVKAHTRYQASFYAKAAPGFSGHVTASIVSSDGKKVYAQARVSGLRSEWHRFDIVLKTGNVEPTGDARFRLSVDYPGTVWFSLVSLFPPTWKHRPNGLRPDLMQMLVDLKPAFLRFPGGNYVEGNTIATRFDWKKTVGPIEQRPGHPCPWGYRSSDGMGLLEFLQWAEDMGAEPVLAVYAGYSLKGAYVKPGPDLQPFIQDALDEIEYVSGPATTPWGAQRAQDGHAKPFPLRYVEIGNEDFFDNSGSYDARFAQFYDAIKAKYPQLKCVSTVGNEQPAAKRVHSRRPDVLDEHYYRSARSFLDDSLAHFDKYDRTGPEIFVGEWGAYEEIEPWKPASAKLPPTPNMKAALADAAWMAAMERNADLVRMQCYAPLLVNVNPGARQWRPNLIGYDALRVYGSPSYYAIQMFSRSYGDTLPEAVVSGARLDCSVTRDSKTGALNIKLVNPLPTPQPLTITLAGIRSVAPKATATTLSADPSDTNSIDQPTRVVPITSKVTGIRPSFTHTFPPCSITILRLETRTAP
jgi:alpha-L-arabinofuranosidase